MADYSSENEGDVLDPSDETEDLAREETKRRSLARQPIREIDFRAPVSVGPTQSAADAVRAMGERGIGCVLVVDQGRLVGIFTERDLLMKVVVAGKRPEDFRVTDVMTPQPETLRPDDTIAFALNLMSVGGYRHIPLVDAEGKPQGVLSVKDIVNFFVEHFPREVLTLPPTPNAGFKTPEGG